MNYAFCISADRQTDKLKFELLTNPYPYDIIRKNAKETLLWVIITTITNVAIATVTNTAMIIAIIMNTTITAATAITSIPPSRSWQR